MAPDPDQPPVSRLLKAGAKGAERVARATGVDRALDEAVEEAIVRALNSEVIDRAIERAVALRAPTVELNAEEIAQLVKRGLDSEAGGRIWAEVLASEQTQMLVERIAGAPEIRAAIAAQSAGLITDIGVRLTRLTEALDDTMERVVRPHDQDELETDQAGLATRLAAAAIDLGLLFGAYSLASGVLASIISVTFGPSCHSLQRSSWACSDSSPPARSSRRSGRSWAKRRGCASCRSGSRITAHATSRSGWPHDAFSP